MFCLFDAVGYDNATSLNQLTSKEKVNKPLARLQHQRLCKAVGADPLPAPAHGLPDLVYAANVGMFLPRLPEPVVLLSTMVNASRAKETPYVQSALEDRGIKTFRFDAKVPWEGQGESVWFHKGHLLAVGYGYRSTEQTAPKLQTVLNRIYGLYGVAPPTVVGVKLMTPQVYHLDIAMVRVREDTALVRVGALHPSSRAALTRRGVHLVELPVEHPFALNIQVLNRTTAVTHLQHNESDRRLLKQYFRKLIEVDVSELEKGGGSVRCCLLNLFYRSF